MPHPLVVDQERSSQQPLQIGAIVDATQRNVKEETRPGRKNSDSQDLPVGRSMARIQKRVAARHALSCEPVRRWTNPRVLVPPPLFSNHWAGSSMRLLTRLPQQSQNVWKTGHRKSEFLVFSADQRVGVRPCLCWLEV